MIVPKVKTKPTREQFAAAFTRAWPYQDATVLGGALMFAQFAFETGWGDYCFNWNLGNVRATPDWMQENDAFELPGAWEIVNGKRVVVGGYFRSHDSLVEGMADHIHFLSSMGRYRHAFDVLRRAAVIEYSKDAAQSFGRMFVRALKAGGYFTGDEDEYSEGVASIAGSLDMTVLERFEEYEPREEAEIIEPSSWGPISLSQAYERLGFSGVCFDEEGRVCR